MNGNHLKTRCIVAAREGGRLAIEGITRPELRRESFRTMAYPFSHIQTRQDAVTCAFRAAGYAHSAYKRGDTEAARAAVGLVDFLGYFDLDRAERFYRMQKIMAKR